MEANYVCGLATIALEAHRLAKTRGDQLAVRSTRRELERLQRELGALRTARDTVAAIEAAHAHPIRLVAS
jgi:hypothetical protein